MHTFARVSNLPQSSCNYSPEDLEAMRHAFRRACDENPSIAASAAQRYALAKAIVNRFEPHFSETDLIAAALGEAH